MTSCRLLSEAHRDKINSAKYYQMQREGLGEEFLDEIDAGIDLICEKPKLWPIEESDVRRYITPRFRFKILYRVRDEIEIIAIMHPRRNPDFWKERL